MKKMFNLSGVLVTSVLIFILLLFAFQQHAKGGSGIVSCILCNANATCSPIYWNGTGRLIDCSNTGCNCFCWRGLWACNCSAFIGLL
jgi:hypothetical protein